MFNLKVDEEIELRVPLEEYAEETFSIVKSNYEHLHEWTNWVNEKTSVETIREFYKSCPKSLKNDNPLFGLVIFYKGKIVGGTGFHEINRSDKSAETGYWLAKEVNGRGIVTKSVKRIIDYAFEEMGMNRIVIKCAPDNLKSRAIPEKLGFTQEGIERDGGRLHTRFVDHVVYSMLAREWAELKK
jgi:ribosomal-protein-serine acetyltransferase